jgi:hypothetical protein
VLRKGVWEAGEEVDGVDQLAWGGGRWPLCRAQMQDGAGVWGGGSTGCLAYGITPFVS